MPTTHTVRTRVQVIITTEVTETTTASSGASAPDVVKTFPGISYDRTFQTGTGTSQFDRASKKSVSLAAAAQDLDLSGSTFTTPGGTAWTVAKLGILAVKNNATTAGYKILALGDANSAPILNTAATTLNVGPDGFFLLVSPIDGIAVTAGTGDIIQLDPGANTIDGEIFVAARSA